MAQYRRGTEQFGRKSVGLSATGKKLLEGEGQGSDTAQGVGVATIGPGAFYNENEGENKNANEEHKHGTSVFAPSDRKSNSPLD